MLKDLNVSTWKGIVPKKFSFGCQLFFLFDEKTSVTPNKQTFHKF